jgi:hypothetical protein
MNPNRPNSLRNETVMTACAGPGCANTITPNNLGRPARYCCTACRVRDHRQHQKADHAPITVEVDIGSASSRGRHPKRAWLVRIRRADRTVIVAIGLRRAAADRLAEQLTELLTDTTRPQGAAID